MNLLQIGIFIGYCLLVIWIFPQRWRALALLVGCLLSVFWLQPVTAIRNLDFWLPAVSIFLTISVWLVTARASANSTINRQAIFLIVICFLGLALTRYTGQMCCLTSTRPPEAWRIGIFLITCGLLLFLFQRLTKSWRYISHLFILILLSLFVFLKHPTFTLSLSAGLRSFTGQIGALASPTDFAWLGFSYLAIRLIHVLRDHQLGKSTNASLGEFITYVLFFPTLTAGPIDRLPRFQGDLLPLSQSDNAVGAKNSLRKARIVQTFAGSERIFLGLFKKFVIADSLALIALTPLNATQVQERTWAWILLYAYALRIYLDFSGYTDIAIGIAQMLGIHVPENFERPYLKTNLTAFWNSWHMTLAQWFRGYVFNPLTRVLRIQPQKIPVWLIILVGQMTTMTLIGAWHGLTLPFILWGVWHGLGLFVHNRWSDWTRGWFSTRAVNPAIQRLLTIGGWTLTFHYVTLGWVLFALPDIEQAWDFYHKLLTGVGG